MMKKVLKGLALAVTIILLTLSLSGCDQIMDLIGLGDDGTEEDNNPELNDNQVLLQKLFSELKKGDDENGFTVSDSPGNVRTRTFSSYTNANGVILNGTDEITFNGPPPPPPGSEQIAGNMAMSFSGTITGGPYSLTLKMTRTPPGPPTYTECKVNSVDMLADYLSMPKQ